VYYHRLHGYTQTHCPDKAALNACKAAIDELGNNAFGEFAIMGLDSLGIFLLVARLTQTPSEIRTMARNNDAVDVVQHRVLDAGMEPLSLRAPVDVLLLSHRAQPLRLLRVWSSLLKPNDCWLLNAVRISSNASILWIENQNIGRPMLLCTNLAEWISRTARQLILLA
jgi:hypothetical protein